MANQVNTLNDNTVAETLQKISAQKTELKLKLSNFVPTTNMNLEIFGKRFNLHVSDEHELKFLFSFLKGLDTTYPHKIGGFWVTSWICDLENKISNLELKTKLNQLEMVEKKLTDMFTPEKKNQIEFDNLLNLLNNF